MRRWMRTCFVLLSLLTVVAGAVASPAAAAPGGNATNAKLCQKGGWQTLARTDAPNTAFVNQDECVSYGAQGGTIVPLQVAPASFLTATDDGTHFFTVSGGGLLQGAPLVLMSLYSDGSVALNWPFTNVDGNGNVTGYVGVGCSDQGDLRVYFTSTTSGGQPISTDVFVVPGCV